MRAIVVQGNPKAPDLVWSEVPDPVPGPGEVLIRVRAAGVNRADLMQVQGVYRAPPGESEILGLEASGIVESWHTTVKGIAEGTRVCALLGGGGYAEKVCVPRDMLLELPQNMNFATAAAIPEVWYTAYLNLFAEAGLAQGETVLIHAGASGVGTAAIQLAKAAGCFVIATSGSEEKVEFCRNLGADLSFNYRQAGLTDVIKQQLHSRPVDVVLDPVGGTHLAQNISLLGQQGRLVLIAVMGGARAELDLAAVVRKRLRIVGSTLRSRPRSEKAAITRRFRTEVWPRFGSAKPPNTSDASYKAVIHARFPIELAAEAHLELAENRTRGKVVLEVSVL